MKATPLYLLALFLTAAFSLASQAQQNNNYWQQEVNYKIDVALDDEQHMLEATAEITYTNNSPTPLDHLWFHLWPNAYRNNSTAFAKQKREEGSMSFAKAAEVNRGYIDDFSFTAYGKKLYWEYHPEHIDIAKVVLNQVLAPGESLTLTIPFTVKIPLSYSRLGHVRQQYQITQWYPKPAVYDSRGWHPMPYLDQGEFYSEFGSFDVSITVPKDYVVGATGNLQTESELAWLNQLAAKTKGGDFSPHEGSPHNGPTKTLRYTQDNVHDFAWFCDKTYVVQKGTVTLPGNNKEVTLWAMYNAQNQEAWADILEYMHDATYYYSLWIGDYPYDVVTVIDGALSAGAGMEYPTITVLGGSDPFSLEVVTMHEIGHNWFYGILASNERRYPWMDEGMNSYYEMRYLLTKYPDRNVLAALAGVESERLQKFFGFEGQFIDKQYELPYTVMARRHLDQHNSLPAGEYTPINYGIIVYTKTAMLMRYLAYFLGQETFDKAMQRYYREWQFKHPWPQDMRSILEQESGKALSWFFDDLMTTTAKVDYSLRQVVNMPEGAAIKLVNKGKVPAPLMLGIYKDGKVQETQWIEGFVGTRWVQVNADQQPEGVMIDPLEIMPEVYRDNNFKRIKGRGNSPRKTQVKLLPSYNAPHTRQLFITPAIGTNSGDGFMFGAAFYNQSLPAEKFQYTLLPMYSTGYGRLSGYYNMNYSLYPGFMRHVNTGLTLRNYSSLSKFEWNVSAQLNKKNMRSSPSQELGFRLAAMGLSLEVIDTDGEPVLLNVEQYGMGELSYRLKGKGPKVAYTFRSALEFSPNRFTRLNNTLSARWNYSAKKSMGLRLFYGQPVRVTDAMLPNQLYGASGSFDPWGDVAALDRLNKTTSRSLGIRQTDGLHGGARAYFPTTTNQWMMALNYDMDLPKVPMVDLFADVVISRNPVLTSPNTALTDYALGLKVDVLPNVFALYVPLVGTNFSANSTSMLPTSFRHFHQNIRFSLNLSNANPATLLKNALE